jgi:site-specific DNA-methyltransferase (adenine-specific)
MNIVEFKGNKNNVIRFILGHNKEWMKEIDWHFYHYGVIDPPYGIDITKRMLGKSTEQIKAIKAKRDRGDWDSKPPDQEFFDLFFHKTRNQIIWGANYMLKEIGRSCEKYYLWDKEQSDKLSFADCEFAWTSFEGAPKMIKRSRMKDVKEEKVHDTQKPIYLYDYLFSDMKDKHGLKEGHRILDTNGGSHTIAVAAWRHNLNLDVIEIMEDNHNNGIEKFKLHCTQGRLDLF